MTDSEYIDGTCPECGHSRVLERRCSSMCEEGFFDDSDEDYLLPGTVMNECDECRGTGVVRWCPECGADLTGKDIFDDEDYDEYEYE